MRERQLKAKQYYILEQNDADPNLSFYSLYQRPLFRSEENRLYSLPTNTLSRRWYYHVSVEGPQEFKAVIYLQEDSVVSNWLLVHTSKAFLLLWYHCASQARSARVFILLPSECSPQPRLKKVGLEMPQLPHRLVGLTEACSALVLSPPGRWHSSCPCWELVYKPAFVGCLFFLVSHPHFSASVSWGHHPNK